MGDFSRNVITKHTAMSKKWKADTKIIDNLQVSVNYVNDDDYPKDPDVYEIDIQGILCLTTHRDLFHIWSVDKIQELKTKIIQKLCS